jgi:hypothetical protein
MNRLWVRKAVLIFVFVAAGFAIACGGGVEGKYRDPTGGIRAEFKGGKVYLALGVMDAEGTYEIKGNKIICHGEFGPMIPSPLVFTVNDDGTIQGPKDSLFPRLEKAK